MAGEFELTERNLKRLIKQRGGYASCLQLNEVLYMQCLGIVTLQNMHLLTGLRALYLESNAIDDLEPLAPLTELRNLFLAKNLIRDLTGLRNLSNLVSLDVSDNRLNALHGISSLSNLQQIIASNNSLSKADDIRELNRLPSLRSVDLSANRIEDESAVESLEQLPLRLLKLNGNPVVSTMQPYRKRLLSSMPTLTYLDESPTFEYERRAAEGYMRGGLEGERAARDAYKEEQREQQERHKRAFDIMVEQSKPLAEKEGRSSEDARYRFKTEKALEELRLIESGLTEAQAQEELRRRSEAETCAQVASVSAALEDEMDEHDDDDVGDKSSTKGSESTPSHVGSSELTNASANVSVLTEIGSSTGDPSLHTAEDESEMEHVGLEDADAADIDEAEKPRVQVVTDLRQEFRSSVGSEEMRATAQHDTIRKDSLADSRSRLRSLHNDHLSKREAWRVAKAWQESKREQDCFLEYDNSLDDTTDDDLASVNNERTSSLHRSSKQRPMVFGTMAYRHLWDMACTLRQDATEGTGTSTSDNGEAHVETGVYIGYNEDNDGSEYEYESSGDEYAGLEAVEGADIGIAGSSSMAAPLDELD